jgi:lysophospholipase L1-like esterase
MGDLCVKDGQRLLFIGDSITDCGRRGDRAPFGDGYVSLFIDLVATHFPKRRITYVNKGIGGNRVTDLRERWRDDVILNRPDWLSVKIGINDLHGFLRRADNAVSPERFREVYDSILAEARRETKARIVLIDPFYISVDRSGQTFRSQVLEIIPKYIKVVHDMGRKYGARLVRTHEVFQIHLKYRGSEVFCPEPVHPNRTGHLIIATELFKVMTA